jgi:hypothetical protein
MVWNIFLIPAMNCSFQKEHRNGESVLSKPGPYMLLEGNVLKYNNSRGFSLTLHREIKEIG